MLRFDESGAGKNSAERIPRKIIARAFTNAQVPAKEKSSTTLFLTIKSNFLAVKGKENCF